MRFDSWANVFNTEPISPHPSEFHVPARHVKTSTIFAAADELPIPPRFSSRPRKAASASFLDLHSDDPDTRPEYARRTGTARRTPSAKVVTSFAEGAICGVTGEGRMTCGVPVATDSITGAPMIIEFAKVQSPAAQEATQTASSGDNKAITQGLAQLLESING